MPRAQGRLQHCVALCMLSSLDACKLIRAFGGCRIRPHLPRDVRLIEMHNAQGSQYARRLFHCWHYLDRCFVIREVNRPQSAAAIASAPPIPLPNNCTRQIHYFLHSCPERHSAMVEVASKIDHASASTRSLKAPSEPRCPDAKIQAAAEAPTAPPSHAYQH